MLQVGIVAYVSNFLPIEDREGKENRKCAGDYFIGSVTDFQLHGGCWLLPCRVFQKASVTHFFRLAREHRMEYSAVPAFERN